jgi:hypothetical protein
MKLLILLFFLNCAKVSNTPLGGTPGLLLSISGIESTYKNAPLIEMNFQFQKGSGDYLSQKIVTYSFLSNSRVVSSTDAGEGVTDLEGRYKVILSTVGQMKFQILETDRTPIGSFTTTVAAVMKKEDIKMENVEGGLGIQVLSIANSYNQFISTETVSNISAPNSLEYSSTNYIFEKDTIIPNLSPSSNGTPPLLYSVNPSLPIGLSFNSTTGIISGTASTVSQGVYKFTVSNSKGSASRNISIIIKYTPPPAPPVLITTGILSNIEVSSLTGWTKCHSETYAASTSLTTIKTNCSKQKIMLSCRPGNNSEVLQLAAYADRDEVFKPTIGNIMNVSNGVGWYYSDSYSMGFAPPGATISRNSCDTASGSLHMCWHTGGGNTASGYRCGSNMGLNGSTGYVREIFHAD